MLQADCTRSLAMLRQQLEADLMPRGIDYELQLAGALELLDQIATNDALSVAAVHQIAHLRRSLHDFYDLRYSRGWTHRFALTELQLLQELCERAPSAVGAAA